MTKFTKKDLAGKKFGRLTVLHDIEERYSDGGIQWACKCDCGNTITTVGYSLTRGRTKSCGCLAREKASKRATTHGMKSSPEYHTWVSLRQRCLNTNNKDYNRYGGRGVLLHSRWRKFENFIEDMGLRPSSSHSIDRTDNDGDYSPENCRWVTRNEQQSNKRNNHLITLRGRTMTQSAWSRKQNIPVDTLHLRLKRGWSAEEALMTKVGEKR